MSAQTTTPIKVVHKEDTHKGACMLEGRRCGNVRKFVPDVSYACCVADTAVTVQREGLNNNLASFLDPVSVFKVACEKKEGLYLESCHCA